VSNQASKPRQKLLWDDLGIGDTPERPPLPKEFGSVGVAGEGGTKPPNHRQLVIWDSVTGGVTPEALSLLEELKEFKELGERRIVDASGVVVGREWVFGLGRSRLALRVTVDKDHYREGAPAYLFSVRDYNRYPIVAERAHGLELVVPASGTQGEVPASFLFSGDFRLRRGRTAEEAYPPNTWDLSFSLPEGFKGIEEDEAELSRAAFRRISEVCNSKAGQIWRDLRSEPQVIANYEEDSREGDPRTDFLVKVIGFRELYRLQSVERQFEANAGDSVRLLWTPEIDRKTEWQTKPRSKRRPR
jgi:hypothetical protein